jgi:lipopolysaccharide/colanic/teichoic acid biosynthesis glycosyltransferase
MRLSKRTLDIIASFFGLLLLAPVFLAIGIWILLEDGAPIFFRQERVGRGGSTFRVLKFRSMRSLPAGAEGLLLTVGRDPRITRSGQWIRRTKLDELPQLWNVLVGEMSLVGPRPEVPRYVARYTPEQRQILDYAPGVTDPASLEFGNESELMAGASDPEVFYLEEILPRKLAVSLKYARNATLCSDLVVILKTVIFQGRQAKNKAS